jgi:hypothetical protein
VLACLTALLSAFVLAGCGDKSSDEGDVKGTFTVKAAWKFPKVQTLGKPLRFVVAVRNVDTRDIPQLIITVNGLSTFVKQPNTAVKTRPVWIPNVENYADVTPNSTATGSSFSLGPLPAGDFHTYVLPLTPIRRGVHPISYSLAPDLSGSAKVEFEGGGMAAERRVIRIDPTPVFDESVFD